MLLNSSQSPLLPAALPPSTFPTELTLAVGPLMSAPFEGQRAFARNLPLGLPSGLSVVYYFMSDNLVLKNLPNLKEYLEYLLSLMESFYFYPAS